MTNQPKSNYPPLPIPREAIAEAVEMLIGDSEAVRMFAQMDGIIELVDRGVPARLTGHPATLNALIDLYTQDSEAFNRVISLIARKRAERNLPPLESVDPQDADAVDRKAYMREFMANKRAKQAELVSLWNQLRAESDRLKGVRRMEFEREHAARWQDEKKRREDAARSRLGRRLSEGERKAIAQSLWEDVQGELDALAEFVRTEVRKPLHIRSRDGFEFTVGVLRKDM